MQDGMNEDLAAQADRSGKKLTDWAEEPSLTELKGDLEAAASSHSSQSQKIKEWLDHLHITNGAKIKTPKGSSQVQPKLIRKQAEWRYASLSEPFLNTDDVFNVSPISWEDKKAAQQNQLVLNNQFNTKLDKVQFIDDYVRAAVDEGTAIVRVGWDFEEEEFEEDVPTVEFIEDPSVGPMIMQLAEMREAQPEQYETEVEDELKQAVDVSLEQGTPFRPQVTGTERVTKTRTLKNEPTLELCHYDDVIFDPTCMGQLKKANFVVYRFASSLSELKKDGKYTNLDNINLQTNNILGEPDEGPDNSSFNFDDKARQKFTVHEYWGYRDIDGSGIVRPIVAAWVGDTLIRLEENPFPDQKPPFVAVRYLPVRRSLYGEPDGALLQDNQAILGAVSRGMIDIMGKSANGQMGVRKDALDITNHRKFMNGQDYEFNGNVDPRQAFYMHTYPEIPVSAQYMVQAQNQEAESLTGVKAFDQGMSGEALGSTATGIRGVLDAASKRELNILRRLARGMQEIGRKIIAMNAVFLDESEVVRITNEEFVEVRRDDLAGNFDLKLSISTAEEDNAKAQELSFMLQTMGNNMDPSMSQMILSDIARLRKMPELAHRIDNYQPQPDPLQQQIQQLEIKKLEAEIAKIQSETVENQAGAQLDQAKAQQTSSETDLKNLDFVERESGVTQERDLQKIGEQAESQAKLKEKEFELEERKDRKERLRKFVEAEKDAS